MATRNQDNTMNDANKANYPYEDDNRDKQQPASVENNLEREIQYLINSGGLNANTDDLKQITKAISNYAQKGRFYLASGTNAITLSASTFSNETNALPRALPTTLTNGDEYAFIPVANNTGATTLTLSGFFNAIPIRKYVNNSLVNLASGDLKNGVLSRVYYSSVNNCFVLETVDFSNFYTKAEIDENYVPNLTQIGDFKVCKTRVLLGTQLQERVEAQGTIIAGSYAGASFGYPLSSSSDGRSFFAISTLPFGLNAIESSIQTQQLSAWDIPEQNITVDGTGSLVFVTAVAFNSSAFTIWLKNPSGGAFGVNATVGLHINITGYRNI